MNRTCNQCGQDRDCWGSAYYQCLDIYDKVDTAIDILISDLFPDPINHITKDQLINYKNIFYENLGLSSFNCELDCEDKAYDIFINQILGFNDEIDISYEQGEFYANVLSENLKGSCYNCCKILCDMTDALYNLWKCPYCQSEDLDICLQHVNDWYSFFSNYNFTFCIQNALDSIYLCKLHYEGLLGLGNWLSFYIYFYGNQCVSSRARNLIQTTYTLCSNCYTSFYYTYDPGDCFTKDDYDTLLNYFLTQVSVCKKDCSQNVSWYIQNGNITFFSSTGCCEDFILNYGVDLYYNPQDNLPPLTVDLYNFVTPQTTSLLLSETFTMQGAPWQENYSYAYLQRRIKMPPSYGYYFKVNDPYKLDIGGLYVFLIYYGEKNIGSIFYDRYSCYFCDQDL